MKLFLALTIMATSLAAQTPQPDTFKVIIIRGRSDVPETTPSPRMTFKPANGNPVLFTDTIPGHYVDGKCALGVYGSPPGHGKLQPVVVQSNENPCWFLVEFGRLGYADAEDGYGASTGGEAHPAGLHDAPGHGGAPGPRSRHDRRPKT